MAGDAVSKSGMTFKKVKHLNERPFLTTSASFSEILESNSGFNINPYNKTVIINFG